MTGLKSSFHILFKVIFSGIIATILSCERDQITDDSGASLEFSTDSLGFDTVFTTIGSATKRLMLYNRNNKPVRVSSISLSGGSSSYFKINADGLKGPEIKDIEIGANDSTFVFVQVFIDPNNQNSPLLVEDSLLCITNGNRQRVNLRAWGQDIQLFKSDTIKQNQIWNNNKPIVVYDYLLVDSGVTLTIGAGTTIYMHRNAWFVVDGTLITNGTIDQPVTFRGDRLDKANFSPPLPYDKIPGQWGELWLRHISKGNKLNYTNIRNAQFGLIVGTLGEKEQAEAELTNCRLENNSAAALYGNNGKIKAVNCVFANAGFVCFATSTGGNYEFYHCTFANYFTLGTKTGISIFLQNFVEIEDSARKKVPYYGELEKAYFGNCIIYGEIADQIAFNKHEEHAFEYLFDHCLIRGTTEKLELSNENRFIKPKISKEPNPGFLKIDKTTYVYNWGLEHKSLARDIGNPAIAAQFNFDLAGNLRTNDDAPDAGAYEYILEGLK